MRRAIPERRAILRSQGCTSSSQRKRARISPHIRAVGSGAGGMRRWLLAVVHLHTLAISAVERWVRGKNAVHSARTRLIFASGQLVARSL